MMDRKKEEMYEMGVQAAINQQNGNDKSGGYLTPEQAMFNLADPTLSETSRAYYEDYLSRWD